MKKQIKLIILTTGIAVLAGVALIILAAAVTDDFSTTSKVYQTSNITVDTDAKTVKLSTTVWTCGSNFTDTRDSQVYTTVLIGSQCWMAQNLNVGTKLLLASGPQGTSCTSAAAIQKYCYSNSDANCTTYGGLYEWNQAMCGGTLAGAQGICPLGWHIPTHDEFTTLERAVCASGSCATDFPFDTSTTGYRGTNEGTKLLSGGSSGFNGLFAGYTDSGSFYGLGSIGAFWSSVQSGSGAWSRYLGSGGAQVYRNTYAKSYGFSVRCLKN